MRIIIETEGKAAQSDVSFHVQAEQAGRAREAGESGVESATDGGQPAQELLSALGAAAASGNEAQTDGPRDGAPRAGEDAGAAPPWLVAVIEGGASVRPTP